MTGYNPRFQVERESVLGKIFSDGLLNSGLNLLLNWCPISSQTTQWRVDAIIEASRDPVGKTVEKRLPLSLEGFGFLRRKRDRNAIHGNASADHLQEETSFSIGEQSVHPATIDEHLRSCLFLDEPVTRLDGCP